MDKAASGIECRSESPSRFEVGGNLFMRLNVLNPGNAAQSTYVINFVPCRVSHSFRVRCVYRLVSAWLGQERQMGAFVCILTHVYASSGSFLLSTPTFF